MNGTRLGPNIISARREKKIAEEKKTGKQRE